MAVVVTYNPDVAAVRATLTAIALQAPVLVVDNSDRDTGLAAMVDELTNVELIGNGGNRGIAHALNVGVRQAERRGVDWVVTLDQDSVLPPGYIATLKEFVLAHPLREQIAIAGGEYFTAGVRDTVRDMPATGEVDFLITSGNLLNVGIVCKEGGFRDELFIDYVDMDLCFRLRRRGYKIVQHPSLGFTHQVGESRWSKVGPVSFVASHHSAMRRYFMTRNRLVFFKENWTFARKFVVRDIYLLFKDTVKVVLVENNKAAKLKAAWLGMCDALRGRLGGPRHKF